MVDRRPVGFVAIILVVTTIATVFIFQIEEQENVEILARRTPENIPAGQPGSPSYSFDLMAVEDLPDLVVRVHFLYKLKEPVLVVPWNETEGSDIETLMSNVPRIVSLRESVEKAASNFGQENVFETFELRGPGEKKVLFVDFTDTIEAFSGEAELKTIRSLFAFEIDRYGNVSVYAGVRDFFFNRDTAITEIRYSYQAEDLCFRSARVMDSATSCDQVGGAPTGRIHLRDLSASDTLHVEVTIDTMNMFGHSGLIMLLTTDTGDGPGPREVSWIGARSS
jgi:hypothetical protein